jgi:hypothetical protein
VRGRTRSCSSRHDPPETATGALELAVGALAAGAADVVALVVGAVVALSPAVASDDTVATLGAVAAALVAAGVADDAPPRCPAPEAARTPTAAVALAARTPAATVRCRMRRTLASRFCTSGSLLPMQAFEQPNLNAS